MKRTLTACILLLALCLSLTACGKADIDADEPILLPSGEKAAAVVTKSDSASTVYKKRTVISEPDVFFNSATRTGDTIYLTATDASGDNRLIYSFDLNTLESTRLDFSTDSSIGKISAFDNASLFLIKSTNTEDSSLPFGFYLKNSLLRLSSEGEILSEYDLDEVVGKDVTVTSLLAAENCVFLSTPGMVYSLDFNGNLIQKFDYTGSSFLSLVRGADGEALICEYNDTEFIVRELSADGKETTGKYTITGRYMGALDGLGSDGIYIYDDNKLYSVDYREGTLREAIDTAINNVYLYSFVYVDSESFFSTEAGVPVIWVPRDESLGEIVTLNLATYDIDPGLSGAITDFNEANEQYKITVTDYAIYDTAESSTAGLTLLNTEILSGNLPDLFDLSKLPGKTYARRGILADLGEWIENDPDISLDDFVSGVVNCLTDSEGHIYEMVPDFVPRTLVGSADVLPSGTGWTVSEFLDWAGSHAGQKIFATHITREDFLQYILAVSSDSYVDYENAACDFKDSDFPALLEFASTLLPENELDRDTNVTSVQTESGEIIAGNQLLHVFRDYVPVSGLLEMDVLFDSKPKFIGFPTNSGSGCVMVPFMRVGMSSMSEKQEGVWAFMKFLLSSAYQDLGDYLPALPVIKKSLEAYINERIEFFTSTAAVITVDWNDGARKTVDAPPPAADFPDRHFEIYDSMDCIYEWDESIYNIILDEASAYFAGQRSVEDTAAMIQSRAQIYVSEQYG